MHVGSYLLPNRGGGSVRILIERNAFISGFHSGRWGVSSPVLLALLENLERSRLKPLKQAEFRFSEKLFPVDGAFLLSLEEGFATQGAGFAATQLLDFFFKSGAAGLELDRGFQESLAAFPVTNAGGLRADTAQEPCQGCAQRAAENKEESKEPGLKLHGEVALADWTEAAFLRREKLCVSFIWKSPGGAKQIC